MTPDPTIEFESFEAMALYALERCTPEFLGKLKLYGLLRIQNRLNGVVDSDEKGTKVVVKS